MDKRATAVLVAMCAIFALFALGACTSGADKPASSAPSSEPSTQASTQQSTASPAESTTEAAINEAAILEQAADAVRDSQIELFGEDAAEHWVVTQNVVKTDMSDLDDLKVYAAYRIDGFNLEGKTLVAEAGSNIMCLVHTSIDGAKADALEIPTDGAGQQEDLLKICGNDKSLVDEMNAACEFSEGKGADLRKAAVADYVQANGIDATAFQDYGWDPIKL